jgi:hypothetical protein
MANGLLFTVLMPKVTGLNDDVVVHTWAALAGTSVADITAAQLEDATDDLIDGYNTVPSGTYAFGGSSANVYSPANLLSGSISRVADACEVRVYDLTSVGNSGRVGSPIYARPWTLGARTASGNDLPGEVAIVVTLEGEGRASAAVELANGQRPKQRRTGRTFWGPLHSSAAGAVAGVMRPHAAAAGAFLEATRRIHNSWAAVGTGLEGMGVWSRSENFIHLLEAVSVDDAFDTMRSRGVSPTQRTRRAA